MNCARVHHRRGQSGWNLLELLISTALLLMVFVFATSEFPTATRAINNNSHYIAASFLAQQVLETARHENFTSISPCTGSQVVSGQSARSLEQALLMYATTVTHVNDNLTDVVVTVTWSELGGNRQVVVETLIDRSAR